MIPLVTPDQMAAVDRAALRSEPLERILDRVGAAVARSAVDLMRGTYGRRVVAVAGTGLNGDDARHAVMALHRRRVVADVIEASQLDTFDARRLLDRADLILDGAVGTGVGRPWTPPAVAAPVLAIDVPSGLDPITGTAHGEPWPAARTVTLAAPKPGLYFGSGPDLAGEIQIADIALDLGPAKNSCHLMTEADVRDRIPTRARTAHKWNHAVLVVAGSPGMTGAAVLCCSAALRGGAGYVHLDSPATSVPGLPIEVVSSLAGRGSAPETSRFSAAVVGPGLGRSTAAEELARAVIEGVDRPLVVDGDGLSALVGHERLAGARTSPTVLTPHDGEFARLTDGVGPGPDRVRAALDLADRYHATVLLKGATTVVASPDGRSRVVTTGHADLATAGTGDVLAGVLAALLAIGLEPLDAASVAAWVHGEAGHKRGLLASDLPDRIAAVLAGQPLG